jgi:uncharacterized protein involved in exopolysaccharide biosynthesis/Mrp family chromosome partitioning ATPase
MNAPPPAAPSRSITVGDIYYLLFRHKWKIVICMLAGLVAAGLVYKTMKPPFRSVAKLFIRFVISEGKAMGPNQSDATAKSPDQRGETIMTGEREIITSGDLAYRVAEAVGPEKILAKAGGGKDLGRAVALIRKGLEVTVPSRSSVIHISLDHPDSDVVQPILREVVERYLKLHVETHRATGMSIDTLVQETDQLKSRLAQTETDLRKARQEAGVVSLEAAKQGAMDSINRTKEQMFAAQTELEAQNAILTEINRNNPDKPQLVAPKLEDTKAPRPELVEEYKGVLMRIANLKSTEESLLLQFTPENARVKEVKALRDKAEEAKMEMIAAHPELLQTSVQIPQAAPTKTAAPASPDSNPIAVISQIVALQARIRMFTSRLDAVRAEAAKIDQLEGTITALIRKKELDEVNYRYYAAALEQARINETLGNGRVSNISIIQSPSAPFPDYTKIYKIVGGLAAGGLLLGLIMAAALEFLLDNSLRRPNDVEQQLQVPLFLEIPHLRVPRRVLFRRLFRRRKEPDGRLAPMHDDLGEEARVFHETLRDRLIAHFESKGLTHKPKLVAVTSVSRGAGVSSVALGLARTLSETGEGNVLLVDLANGQTKSQHFVDGRPLCELSDLLASRDSARVNDNLYVVTEAKANDELSRKLPMQFSKLVPKLKASDFDYIIFDMPRVSQISITPRLASFMDMVMLVVESEKTNRDLAKRAITLLRQSKANVGVVFNKTRTYVPARLQQELLVSP